MNRICGIMLGVAIATHAVAGQSTRPMGIETRRIMTLGTDAGPGSFAGVPVSVAKMSDGRIIVAGGVRVPTAFDASGKFLKELGERGEGPGEFAFFSLGPIRVGPGDTMFIPNRLP